MGFKQYPAHKINDCKGINQTLTYMLYDVKYHQHSKLVVSEDIPLAAINEAGWAIHALMHSEGGSVERIHLMAEARRKFNRAWVVFHESFGHTYTPEQLAKLNTTPIRWGGYDGRAIILDKRSHGLPGEHDSDYSAKCQPRTLPAHLTF